MFRLWIENEKKEMLELTNSPFYESVIVEGLLPPKATINRTVLANADGSNLDSTRVEERQITITIKPAFPIEENRQRLYQYFKTKKEVTLYFQNQNRNVKIKGLINDFDGSLFAQKQTISVYIDCLNPYFEQKEMSYAEMSQVLDLFEFPFTIEKEGIEFSRIDKTLMQNIYNAGDTETGIIIEITTSGTVVNPIIYNADTREFFGINITMQFGDMIRINTNQFNKEMELIRYGESRNIINNIKKGSKWFKLSSGDNIFTYDCESGDEFIRIKFIYSNLYEGV